MRLTCITEAERKLERGAPANRLKKQFLLLASHLHNGSITEAERKQNGSFHDSRNNSRNDHAMITDMESRNDLQKSPPPFCKDVASEGGLPCAVILDCGITEAERKQTFHGEPFCFPGPFAAILQHILRCCFRRPFAVVILDCGITEAERKQISHGGQ